MSYSRLQFIFVSLGGLAGLAIHMEGSPSSLDPKSLPYSFFNLSMIRLLIELPNLHP
jgi:hypothetical protein